MADDWHHNLEPNEQPYISRARLGDYSICFELDLDS